MENIQVPQPAPAPAPAPICPHCKGPFTQIAWVHNPEASLFTFYHNQVGCMAVLNCQLVPTENRIQVGGALPPRPFRVS